MDKRLLPLIVYIIAVAMAVALVDVMCASADTIAAAQPSYAGPSTSIPSSSPSSVQYGVSSWSPVTPTDISAPPDQHTVASSSPGPFVGSAPLLPASTPSSPQSSESLYASASPYHVPQPQNFLEPQNQERAFLGEAPLTWDDHLADYAFNYACTIRDQFNCELVHSHGPYGENLSWCSDLRTMATSEAVNDWIAEKAYYDSAANACTGGEQCEHYTQIIWAETSHVGCASVLCNSGQGVVSVCSYYPQGNVVGQKPFP